MPLVYAVNGVLETYAPKPVTARSPVVRKDATSDHAPNEEGAYPRRERSGSPALDAYRQQAQPRPTKSPALLAQDIMSVPAISAPGRSRLSEAWDLMQRKGIRHLPIVSPVGALTGIVSDRDLFRFTQERNPVDGSPLFENAEVAAIMHSPVLCATPHTDVRDVARVMVDERIGAVPIIDRAQRPIGIITASDILRAVANHKALELWT